MATRELYTDADEVIFNYTRPIILNGIESLTTRPDLQDRSLIVTLDGIPEDRRCAESDLWVEFQKALPEILGGFLDACCAVLRNLPHIRLFSLPRMADFARRVLAAELGDALPWEKGGFADAYGKNRSEAIAMNLESSVLGLAVQRFMQDRVSADWRGSATELLEELNRGANESMKNGKSWPKSPSVLSSHLRRIMPLLRAAAGIDVHMGRASGTGKREILLTAVTQSSGDDGNVTPSKSEQRHSLNTCESGSCIDRGPPHDAMYGDFEPLSSDQREEKEMPF
jgi:hypothetical protein